MSAHRKKVLVERLRKLIRARVYKLLTGIVVVAIGGQLSLASATWNLLSKGSQALADSSGIGMTTLDLSTIKDSGQLAKSPFLRAILLISDSENGTPVKMARNLNDSVVWLSSEPDFTIETRAGKLRCLTRARTNEPLLIVADEETAVPTLQSPAIVMSPRTYYVGQFEIAIAFLLLGLFLWVPLFAVLGPEVENNATETASAPGSSLPGASTHT